MNSIASNQPMINVTFTTAINIEKEYIVNRSFTNFINLFYDYYGYPGTHMPLICNTVFGFDFPKTLPPLTHYVGPLLTQINPPLDESLNDWLSTKQDRSVIYVGMGSIEFPMSKEYLRMFLDGILASSFDAVWTLSTDEQEFFEIVDKNRFYLSKWIPCQTLFKHRAIAMTLMHCGLNGVQESLFNGLPVICTPLFPNHFEVADRLSAAHVGIPLYGIMHNMDELPHQKNNITAEVITSAIESIAKNKTYIERAKKMQKVYSFAGGTKRAADLVEFYAEVGYDHLIPAYAKYGWGWVHWVNLAVYSVPSSLLSTAFLICICCICAHRQDNWIINVEHHHH